MVTKLVGSGDMEGRIDGWMDELNGGKKDGRVVGWMGEGRTGNMGGCMDGRKRKEDGWIE